MYALIMAGGVGSRFWPRSRLKTPKHLLSIVNDRTMLENTVARMDELVERKNCFIITNREQKDNIISSIIGLSTDNIIAEPFGRNTAAAIGYGAVMLLLKDPEALMVVLPADHYIKNVPMFKEVINRAVAYCGKDPEALITIGIEPTHPETGYGYIQIGSEIEKGVHNVKSFAEKPNLDTALRFLQSGEFYWNSGMFIWKAETIMKNIKKFLPDLYESLIELRSAVVAKEPESVIEKIYAEMRSISIDYGVMESADNVKVLLGNFGWSDVGSWQEIYRLKDKDEDGNVVDGARFISIDTRNCLISSDDPDKLITCIGLKDTAVIETGDSILITPLSRSQEVKELVEKLKTNGHHSVL